MALIVPAEFATNMKWTVTARIVYLVCVMAIAAASMVMLATLPGYINMRSEKQNLSTVLDATMKNAEEQEKNAGRETLLGSKRRIEALSAIVAPTEASRHILDVVSVKPSGVALTAFSYVHKNGEGTLVVSGTVTSRAALSGYVQALEASKRFSSVVVPITTLARVEEGEFDITLSGNF